MASSHLQQKYRAKSRRLEPVLISASVASCNQPAGRSTTVEGLPMMESTLKSANRPFARIYRAGQACEIQPAFGSLRRALQTVAHVAASRDDQPLSVFTVPIPLFDEIEVIGKPGIACRAGWEPVI